MTVVLMNLIAINKKTKAYQKNGVFWGNQEEPITFATQDQNLIDNYSLFQY